MLSHPLSYRPGLKSSVELFIIAALYFCILIHNFISVKLNGGRHVQGILRGFDPFMNVVLDESVEIKKDGNQNNVGMCVSYLFQFINILLISNILVKVHN